MTVLPPEQLVSPGERFLQEGGDPFATPDRPWEAEEESDTNWKAYLAIAAGFLVARKVIQDRARRKNAAEVAELESAIPQLQEDMAATYAAEFAPALRLVYNEAPDASALAETHALEVGKMLAEVSAKALAEGFHAGMNTGLVPQVAWARATEALGLDSRQMRQWLPTAAGDGYTPSLVADGARKALDRALWQRADRVAENEVFVGRNLARQARWIWWARTGRIPKTSQKRWETAKDEMVCPVCRPLHGQTRPVREPFEVDGRKVWNAGVHPNCRCRVALIVPKHSATITVRKDVKRVASPEGEQRYGKPIGAPITAQDEQRSRSWRDIVPPMREEPTQPTQPTQPTRPTEQPQVMDFTPERQDPGLDFTDIAAPASSTPQTPWYLRDVQQTTASPALDFTDLAGGPSPGQRMDQSLDFTDLAGGPSPGQPVDQSLDFTDLAYAQYGTPQEPKEDRSVLNQWEQTTYLAEPLRVHMEERVTPSERVFRLPGDDIDDGRPMLDSLDPRALVGRVFRIDQPAEVSLGSRTDAVQQQIAQRLRRASRELADQLDEAEGQGEAELRTVVTQMYNNDWRALGDAFEAAVLNAIADSDGERRVALHRVHQHISEHVERGSERPATEAYELVVNGASDDTERALLAHLGATLQQQAPHMFEDAARSITLPDGMVESTPEATERILGDMASPVVVRFRGWTGQNAPNNPTIGQATGHYKITGVKRRRLGDTEFAPDGPAGLEDMGVHLDDKRSIGFLDTAIRMDAVTEIIVEPIDEQDYAEGLPLGMDDVDYTSASPPGVERLIEQARRLSSGGDVS